VKQVVGVSRFVLDRHAGIFPNAHQHVIRHPVHADLRGPVVPPAERLGSIGYIGSLDRIKGVHLLLEAAPQLATLGCTLRLAGQGRLEPEVSEAAARGVVSYEGSVDGELKSAFLASCDLGVVPSVWNEPGGPTYTMIEWLSAGRPVLVSRRGGLGEVIESYPGAIPADPTVAGIVGEVESLSDPRRWREAVSSVRSIDADGAIDRWVDAYERIYRQLG
jgi:glycosyltransferase involved in cell wall biosynthesis